VHPRISPAADVLQTIALPVRRPASSAFGSERHDTLFVTSARAGLGEAGLTSQPGAGSLFSITGIGQGLSAPAFAG